MDTLGHLLSLMSTPANEQDCAQVHDLCVQVQEVMKGFILLPKRWVVERSFGWLSRFRRLGRDLERLPQMLLGFHTLAFCLLLSAKLIA